MRASDILLIVPIASVYALPQVALPKDPASCPALPKEASLGPAVEMNKADVPTGCTDLEVLVARGTSEVNDKAKNGKFGIIVGDQVITNLTKVMPTARGYPVQYPASGNMTTGVRVGWQDVVNRLKQQDKDCPNQKFALVGYSQGAVVMHYAAKSIPEALYPKIISLVMYGDPITGPPQGPAAVPEFPAALQTKLLMNCAEGDRICDKGGKCFLPHLTYIRKPWVDKTVNFIVSAFKGTPLPSKLTGLGP